MVTLELHKSEEEPVGSKRHDTIKKSCWMGAQSGVRIILFFYCVKLFVIQHPGLRVLGCACRLYFLFLFLFCFFDTLDQTNANLSGCTSYGHKHTNFALFPKFMNNLPI